MTIAPEGRRQPQPHTSSADRSRTARGRRVPAVPAALAVVIVLGAVGWMIPGLRHQAALSFTRMPEHHLALWFTDQERARECARLGDTLSLDVSFDDQRADRGRVEYSVTARLDSGKQVSSTTMTTDTSNTPVGNSTTQSISVRVPTTGQPYVVDIKVVGADERLSLRCGR